MIVSAAILSKRDGTSESPSRLRNTRRLIPFARLRPATTRSALGASHVLHNDLTVLLAGCFARQPEPIRGFSPSFHSPWLVVSPNFDAYVSGHSEGVKIYCRPQNGFQVGRRGHSYAGVCPANLEQPFLTAYNSGRHIYTLTREVTKLNSLIKQRIAALEATNDDIAGLEQALINEKTTRIQRTQMLADIKELSKVQHDLAVEIRDLELEKEDRQAEVDYYIASAGY